MQDMTGKLTVKQERAVQACLLGGCAQEVADIVGVSASTIHRWRLEPHFKTALGEARQQAFEAGIGAIQRVTVKAARVLEEVLDDKEAPTHARVSAAKAVMDAAFKGLEVLDLNERLKALEAGQCETYTEG
jgi:transposase-like protein